jgi:hypothetical protein
MSESDSIEFELSLKDNKESGDSEMTTIVSDDKTSKITIVPLKLFCDMGECDVRI